MSPEQHIPYRARNISLQWATGLLLGLPLRQLAAGVRLISASVNPPRLGRLSPG